MVTSISQPVQSMEESEKTGGVGATSLQSIVPACPQGLCVTKTDFLKQDFSVDNFFIEVNCIALPSVSNTEVLTGQCKRRGCKS